MQPREESERRARIRLPEEVAQAQSGSAHSEPRGRGLGPRSRRRRTRLPASFAGAHGPEKPVAQAFSAWGRGQGRLPIPRLSVQIFQDGGDEVRGRQGCFRLLPSGQTFALAGHGPGAGLFRGEAWGGAAHLFWPAGPS